jgi:SnoaL-like domain
MSDSAEQVLRKYWARIDARDWDGMAQFLDPGLHARYPDTGEKFDSAGAFVRVTAEYPGVWRATVLYVVGAGDRAVSCTRLERTDQAGLMFVASFATVRDGRVAELTELWTDGGKEVPTDRRPDPAGPAPA